MPVDTTLSLAIERHLNFLAQDPDNGELQLELARLHLRGGDPDVAVTHALEGARLLPDRPEARDLLTTAYIASARYVDAQAEIMLRMEDGEISAALYHTLGVSLYGQHRWQAAAEAFAEAHQRGLELPLNLAYWTRALHANGDFDAAAKVGLMLVAADPRGPHVGHVSLVLLESGRPEAARQLAEQALSAHPDDTAGHTVLGLLATEQLDYELAKRHFEPAVRSDPSNTRAHIGLGLTHLASGEPQLAIRFLSESVRLQPASAGNVVALGWAQLLANDPAGAEATFESAQQVDRTFAESHGGLAAALAYQHRTEEAWPAIQRARRLNPNGFGAEYAEAVLLANAGEHERAANLLRQTIVRAPGHEEPAFIQLLRRHAIATSTDYRSAIH